MFKWFGKQLWKMHERNASGEAGFTLIELLVVIIIIGILAAIAIPVFLAQRDKAREAAAQSDLRNAAAAATACSADNDGSYATCTEANLIADYDLKETDGVNLTVTNATDNNWTATAVHTEDSDPTVYTFNTDVGHITS